MGDWLREAAALTTRVFLHGLESSSQGVKGAFFKARYPGMIVEDFSGSFEQRMAKLRDILQDKDDLIIVGSSYGGLMAAVFACERPKKIRRLILLAPALNHMPPASCSGLKLDFPVIIYHGSQDEVVPPEPVHTLARKLFTDLTYHLVEDDHSLHRTFLTIDWDALLS